MNTELLTLWQDLAATRHDIVARKRLKAARTRRFLAEQIPTPREYLDRTEAEIKKLEAEEMALELEIRRHPRAPHILTDAANRALATIAEDHPHLVNDALLSQG